MTRSMIGVVERLRGRQLDEEKVLMLLGVEVEERVARNMGREKLRLILLFMDWRISFLGMGNMGIDMVTDTVIDAQTKTKKRVKVKR